MLNHVFALKRSSAMKKLCSSFKVISPNLRVDERMIWEEITRLTLCVRGLNAFNKVTTIFGKCMFFEVDRTPSMSMCHIFISTKHTHFLIADVQVQINGGTFSANVHKLGSWSINIEDDHVFISLEGECKDGVSTSDSDEVAYENQWDKYLQKCTQVTREIYYPQRKKKSEKIENTDDTLHLHIWSNLNMKCSQVLNRILVTLLVLNISNHNKLRTLFIFIH